MIDPRTLTWLTRETVLPGDIDSEFKDADNCASPFIDMSIEEVVTIINVVRICQQNGNYWLDFTADEYQFYVASTNMKHVKMLHRLEKLGLLSFNNGAYQITDRFIQMLYLFISISKLNDLSGTDEQTQTTVETVTEKPVPALA
jgi:hypothetical protein